MRFCDLIMRFLSPTNQAHIKYMENNGAILKAILWDGKEKKEKVSGFRTSTPIIATALGIH